MDKSLPQKPPKKERSHGAGDALEDRVLLLSITPEAGTAICESLKGVGITCTPFSCMEDLCREINDGAAALILTEEALGGTAIKCIRGMLNQQPEWSDLPVILLLHGGPNSPAAEQAVRQLKNVVVLDRPARESIVLSVVLSAVQSRRRQYQVRKLLAELRELNLALDRRVAERSAEAEARLGQLKALTHELTQTEQRERRRLAQFLHDHLQQILVTARMHVGVLRRQTQDTYAQQLIAEVVNLLNQAVVASRSLTMELSPPVLHDAGLVPALEWLARRMREQHHLDVQVQADPKAEPELDDLRSLLFEAVRELLLNVVKHAQTDTARVEVRLGPQETVHITVEDKGVGFDASEALKHQAPPETFGLFSIQQRLYLMGGQMTIESDTVEGTRISLIVPKRRQPLRPATGRPLGAPAIPAPTLPRKIRVLLADDHKILREGLARLLRHESDIEVVAEANDGEEAVAQAGEAHPDVIIMDITMPRMSGLEATRRIHQAFPSICVIGLSMHAEEDMAEAMRQAGAVGYVTKGGPAEDLLTAIRACTRGRD